MQGPNASVLRFNGQADDARQVQIALDAHNLPPLPAGTRAVSDFHRFTPSGVAPEGATLRVPLAATAMRDGTQARLLALNDQGQWAEVPGAQANSASLTAPLGLLSAAVAVVSDPTAAGPDRNSYAASVGTAAVVGSPITANPLPLNLNVGGSGSFSVGLSFQDGDRLAWISTPAARAGALGISCPVPNSPNGAYCAVNNAQLAQDGAQIRFRLTRGTTVYESAPATLTVTSAAVAPSLVQSPVAVTVDAGQTANFSADASGTAPLSWQWLKDGVAITGANTKALALPTTAAEAGRRYAVSVRVSNSKGTVTSPAVELTVKTPGTLVTAAAGGTLPGPDGSEIVIPPGALTLDTKITVTRETVPAGLLPAGYTALGGIVRIEPAVLSLKKPIELRYPVPPVPAGHTLVLLLVSETSTARILSATSGAGGVKPLGAVDTGKAVCSNLQNKLSNDLLPMSFLSGGRYAVASTALENCTGGQESRVTTPDLPSITDEECTKDGDFFPGSDQSLLSRHVDCKSSITTGMVVQVDYKRTKPTKPSEAPGAWSVLSGAGFDGSKIEVQSVEMVRGAQLETQVSVYGPANELTKRVSVRARLVGGSATPEAKLYPGFGGSIKARFVVRCTNSDACVDPADKPLKIEVNLPASGGWSNRAGNTVAFKDPSVGNKLETSLDLSRLEYAAGTNSYSTPFDTRVITKDPEGLRVWGTTADSTPQLVCDNGMAKRLTKGCVFDVAAAVWSLSGSPAAGSHIAGSTAYGELGIGRFKTRPETRALPDPAVVSKHLQRTRNVTIAKTNRSVASSVAFCGAPTVKASTCEEVDEFGDPKEFDGKCDCDEYPFASTLQGGDAPGSPLSVKKIPATDNQRAGRDLGTFYLKQRIKDDQSFWVKPN